MSEQNPPVVRVADSVTPKVEVQPSSKVPQVRVSPRGVPGVPGDVSSLSKEATQAEVLAALQGTLRVAQQGPVTLDADSLAALEQITAVVNGPVALDAATLAALEEITVSIAGAVAVANWPADQAVHGTVALDAATLTALEQVTATVSNWPADYPSQQNHNDLVALITAVATSAGQTAVQALIEELAANDSLRREFTPPRQFAVPRDANDRLLVTVGSSATVTTGTLNLWAQGSYVPHYNTGVSLNTIDGRELLQSQWLQAFQQRRSRWVIT